MKRKFSIYHFLVVLMMFTLLLPAFAGATAKESPTGSLTIYKFEQEPGTDVGAPGDGSMLTPQPEGKPVEGVEFTFTQTHSYDANEDKWSETSGTPFTRVTDADGRIVIDDIDLGRYTVQETDGPKHIVLNDTEYSVDIPMTNPDGSSLNYDVHIYPKNETIRGGAVLTKFINETEEMLDGAKFKVYKKDGTVVTDEDGNEIVLTSSGGTVEIDGLAYGEYYFQEIASVDGYLLNGEKVPFTVEGANTVAEVELQNYSKPEVEKKVDKTEVNRGEQVTFTISVTLPKDISNYERFEIKDMLDDRLEYVDGSQSGAAGFDFAQNGQLLTWTANDFSALTPGTIEITFDAKVKKDATPNEPIPNKGEIDYNNKYVDGGEKTPPVTVTPTAGSLTVKKVDGDSDEGLAGAVFELRDENGTVVVTGTSGSDGNVDFGGETEELDYGTYQLVETKAPADYNLLRNPIDVTIDKENTEVNLTIDNFKSGWDLPKTGGIGTMLFTFIGLSLMGTASYMFTRRRKGESV